MKIAELFIALKFKGDLKQLDKTNAGLKEAALRAMELKLEISSLVDAFVRLNNESLKYAVGLKNFAVQTGLSVAELEKWRYAAEKNDVTAQEFIGSITALQDAMVKITRGQGNMIPWNLLGIDPRNDPFTILEQLRAKMKDFHPSYAKSLLEEMGLGPNMMNILKAANLEFDKMRSDYILNPEEIKTLISFNREIKEMIWQLRGLRNKVFSDLSGPASAFIKTFNSSVTAILKFEQALSGITRSANKIVGFKSVFAGIGIGLAIAFAPITTAIAGIILLLDDLNVYLEGGDSLIGKILKMAGPIKNAFSNMFSGLKEISTNPLIIFEKLGLLIDG